MLSVRAMEISDHGVHIMYEPPARCLPCSPLSIIARQSRILRVDADSQEPLKSPNPDPTGWGKDLHGSM